MADKVCTACSWDGTLTRLACPSCKTDKWYCSDCHVGNRAFNCGDCQQPQQADVNEYVAVLATEWEDIEF